jgi:uncharacterized protein involved in exopolysaccharide biosynthesis
MTGTEQKSLEDDEISLIDLFAVLWCRKAMILAITLTATVAVVVFAVVSIKLPPEKSPLPNEYTPTALMIINDASSSGGGMASMLASSGLGGLAGLAGATGPTFSELAIYLVGTNTLLDSVVNEFDLISRYKIKKFYRAESRKALKKNLTASYDEKAGSSVFPLPIPILSLPSRLSITVLPTSRSGSTNSASTKNKLEKENLQFLIATRGVNSPEMPSPVR